MFHEGQQIGPYKLSRRLGRGGFGEVWLGERHGKFATTQVAVKLPLDEQVDHSAIEHEAQLWARASGHPNVLPIIEADEYDGQVVIVSEYAPGGSLEDWLKTHGKMSVEKSVETTIQILDGLEFLHSRNIIHRDLKPANILLQGKTPRLADFGISRAIKTTAASQSQNISGTFAYMSPEALDGKRSVQTDIWSVGVNLYQFLTGTLPFPQKEPSVLFPAIIMREFVPLPADIPQSLRNVVAKALTKLPENRYKTVGEMREELKKVLVNVSFPHFVPREILPNASFLEIISAPVSVENETVISKKVLSEKLTTEQNQGLEAKEINTHVKIKPRNQVETNRKKAEREERQHNSAKKQQQQKLAFIAIGVLTWVVIISGLIWLVSSKSTSNVATNKSDNRASISLSNTFKNSIGMEFVKIPSGSFMMGSGIAERQEAFRVAKRWSWDATLEWFKDEGPIRKVIIGYEFYLGKYEVTQEEYEKVMETNPSRFEGCPKCPVENVNWNDAKDFIRKLNSENDGYEYRLPSEAEWEYAARGGKEGQAFGIGDGKNLSSEQANFNGNYPYGNALKGKYLQKTVPIGSYQPNPFGLYDMHGNLNEWCEDIYADSYSNLSADGSANVTIGDSKMRVLRGGAWLNIISFARSATRRLRYDPDERNDVVGFRIVARPK